MCGPTLLLLGKQFPHQKPFRCTVFCGSRCASVPTWTKQTIGETLGSYQPAVSEVNTFRIPPLDPTLSDREVVLRQFTPPRWKEVEAWGDSLPPTSPQPRDLSKLLPSADQALGLRPGIVFMHGGGFVICGNGSHDHLLHRLAVLNNAIVFAVEYAKAPEDPWPAAAEDTFAALQHVSRHAAGLGVSSRGLFVMGDSAGGNLAAVSTLWARDGEVDEKGQPLDTEPEAPHLVHPLAGQVLVYPTTAYLSSVPGAGLDLGSVRQWGHNIPWVPWGRRFLTAAAMRLYHEAYLADIKADLPTKPHLATHPHHSPLFAHSHQNLPPALIVLAEIDVLRDDGLRYADALRLGGGYVQIVDLPGTQHAFWNVRALYQREVGMLERAVTGHLETCLRAVSATTVQGSAVGILQGTSSVPCHKPCPAAPTCSPTSEHKVERTPAEGGTLGGPAAAVAAGLDPADPQLWSDVEVDADGILVGDAVPEEATPGSEYYVGDDEEAEAMQAQYARMAQAEAAADLE